MVTSDTARKGARERLKYGTNTSILLVRMILLALHTMWTKRKKKKNKTIAVLWQQRKMSLSHSIARAHKLREDKFSGLKENDTLYVPTFALTHILRRPVHRCTCGYTSTDEVWWGERNRALALLPRHRKENWNIYMAMQFELFFIAHTFVHRI